MSDAEVSLYLMCLNMGLFQGIKLLLQLKNENTQTALITLFYTRRTRSKCLLNKRSNQQAEYNI